MMMLCVQIDVDNLQKISRQQLSEGVHYDYTLRLTDAPSSNVTVDIASDWSCSVSSSAYTFTAANFDTGKSITVSTANNDVDEGTNANAYSACSVAHTRVT